MRENRLIFAGALLTLVLLWHLRRLQESIERLRTAGAAAVSTTTTTTTAAVAAAPSAAAVPIVEPVPLEHAEFYLDTIGYHRLVDRLAARRVRIHRVLAWNVGPKSIVFRCDSRAFNPQFASFPTQAGIPLDLIPEGYWDTGLNEEFGVTIDGATPLSGIVFFSRVA